MNYNSNKQTLFVYLHYLHNRKYKKMTKKCSVCKESIENGFYIKMQSTLHSSLDDQEKGEKHTHIIHFASFNSEDEQPVIHECLKKHYEGQLLEFNQNFNQNAIVYVKNLEK